MSDEDPRPEECCGVCPPLMRGGYDCTCRGNERCQGPQATDGGATGVVRASVLPNEKQTRQSVAGEF